MQAKFEMSMIGELTHFLRLQIHQQDSGIFLFQSKYAKNLVKKFGLESVSTLTLIGQGMLMIERVLQGVVFMWEIILSPG